QLPGVKGIVVENAQPELFEATVKLPFYCSRLVLADGVLDGLRHHGVLSELPSAQAAGQPGHTTTPGFRMLETVTRPGALDAGEKDFLKLAYEKALVALRKNITPLGFSACSLADNVSTG